MGRARSGRARTPTSEAQIVATADPDGYTAELAGDIPVSLESMNVSLQRHGKTKIQGLTSARRLGFAADLPTIAQTLPGYDLDVWQSIVAPADTPPAIVGQLAAAVGNVMVMPDVRERLLAAGTSRRTSTRRKSFAAVIRWQTETRARVIKAAGMRLDGRILTAGLSPCTRVLLWSSNAQ